MATFVVTWESWERGSVKIKAKSEAEARRIFDEEHVGTLEADGEGLDIVGIEEVPMGQVVQQQ